MNNKRILITGCAGFIGSHAVDLFLESDYDVVGVDCLTYAGSLKNLDKSIKHKDFTFYKTDICDTKNMIKYCADHKASWILNFAAETHVDNSIESCDKFIHSNINGVKSLLECCKSTGVNIFHISTDEVYGSIIGGSFNEEDSLNPKNPYSATKAAGEHLIIAYQNTYDIKFLIARPSNNFGPRQNDEKFIPTILRNIAAGTKVPLYGDGKNIRDWLFVKDNVLAIKFILENSYENEIFNITLSDERENIDVVESILSNFNLSFKDWVSFVNDRPGHDFRYSINNDKLKKLGFRANYSFEENLKETIESYTEG